MDIEVKKKKIVIVKKKVKKLKNNMTTIAETQEPNTSKSEINTNNNTLLVEDSKSIVHEVNHKEIINENESKQKEDLLYEIKDNLDISYTNVYHMEIEQSNDSLKIEKISEEFINKNNTILEDKDITMENKHLTDNHESIIKDKMQIIKDNRLSPTNPLKLDIMCSKPEEESFLGLKSSILNKYIDNKALTYLGAAVSLASLSYYMYKKLKK
jgi:hypothetical protein